MKKILFNAMALVVLLCCGASAWAADNVVSTDFTKWPFYTTNKQSDGGNEVHFFLVKVKKVNDESYLNGVPYKWYKEIYNMQCGNYPKGSPTLTDNGGFIVAAARQKYIKMLCKYPMQPIFSIENDGMYFRYDPAYENTFDAYNAALSDSRTDFLDDATLNAKKKSSATVTGGNFTEEYYKELRGYMGTDITYAKEKGIEKFFILAVGVGKTLAINADGTREFDCYGNIKMKIAELRGSGAVDAADDFTPMKNGEWQPLNFTPYNLTDVQTVNQDLVNLQGLYNAAQAADESLAQGQKAQTPTIYSFIPFTLKKFEHAKDVDYGIRMFFNPGPLVLHANAIEYDKGALTANTFNQWDFNAGGIVDHYEMEYSTASVSPTEENWKPYPGYNNIPSHKTGVPNNFCCIQGVDLTPIYNSGSFIDDQLQFRIKSIMLQAAVDAGMDPEVKSNVIKVHFTEELPYVSGIKTKYVAGSDEMAQVSFDMTSGTIPASVRNNICDKEYTEYVVVRDGDYDNFYTLTYKLDSANKMSSVKDTINIKINTANGYKVITGYSFSTTSVNTAFASPASNNTDVLGSSIAVDIDPSMTQKGYNVTIPCSQTNKLVNKLTIDKIVNGQKTMKIGRKVYYSTTSATASFTELKSCAATITNPAEEGAPATASTDGVVTAQTTYNDEVTVSLPQSYPEYWVKFVYNITITDENGNTATSGDKELVYHFKRTLTGIDDVTGGEAIEVYPNPVTSVINVKGGEVNSVEVFDMSGRRVIATDQATVAVDTLAAGVYLVRINGDKVVRIVKK